jgi:3-oxoacyl-[acyl-carrier-protein] synthase-3
MSSDSPFEAGIISIGKYLPPTRRENSFWDRELPGWREKTKARREAFEEMRKSSALRPEQRAVLDALIALGDDPFQGGRTRFHMAAEESAADMEEQAAREALALAKIDVSEIDAVMSHALTPDYINAPQACVLHYRLGLSETCMAFAVDAVCNSFLMQLSLAAEKIRGGRARYVLITQCSANTRLKPSGEPHDSWFGDGATAVIVGRVPPGRGLLAEAHFTDGSLHRALLAGVPGRRWFDGAPITYSEDRVASTNMFLNIVTRAEQALAAVLERAGVDREQIGFYACHQAFEWLRPVSQRHLRLVNAKSVDTFSWAGTLSSANLPLVLSAGEREGLLASSDLVFLFQGGTGMTWSGALLRWT